MRWILLVALSAATPAATAAGGMSVRGSKHDLSVNGPGPIKAERETQVCIFCHVAHLSSANASPLSDRPEIGNTHVPYGSSTSRALSSAPSGTSRVCLSCHDGTIAVGETNRRRIPMNAAAPGGRIPASRRSNLGTDLRKTHPISVPMTRGKDLRDPRSPTGSHLDSAGQVQCTSCHDAHAEFGGSPEGKFLRMPTERSQLCADCHVFSSDSAHFRSSRAFAADEGNEAGYASVGAAGCAACHRSHGADARGRLLARAGTEGDDALCLRCHSGGRVADADIGRELAKPYAHAGARGKHDASEGPGNPAHRLPEISPAAERHVSCVDCHDPHLASRAPARAPNVSGLLAGASGIDLSGDPVIPAAFEYQVCLKCHGDSANRGVTGSSIAAPRRAAHDGNLRRVFDPSSPSSHPVAGPGRSMDAPSLRPPYVPGSVVYCTDCHASDSGGPRGPHGSTYPFLLERRYTTGAMGVEGPDTYALCYKCHDRDVLLSDRSAFRLHRRHVLNAQAPCSVCHAAHGVSSWRGSSTSNAHLIDFDLDVVRPGPAAAPAYTTSGPRRGSCNVVCHGARHDAVTY